MSTTADSSCGELSEELQRNAKPRKRGDFRHQNDGLYAAKHKARLLNISGYFRLGDGQKRSEMESLASPECVRGCVAASLRSE
jgi:hypothetical protein